MARLFCLCFRKKSKWELTQRKRRMNTNSSSQFLGLECLDVHYALDRKILAYICGKIEENDNSVDLGADERKILKMLLKEITCLRFVGKLKKITSL
jgi:hypothetical protein